MIVLAIDDGIEVNEELIGNYFKSLVNCIFKILPMKENNESSLDVYMRSLQSEMAGCYKIIDAIENDGMFLSLLAILQYQIDNPGCPVNITRREVFKAIALCNKLKAQYIKGAK